MYHKAFLLIILLISSILTPSYSDEVAQEFTITAVLPNVNGKEFNSISVVDIRDSSSVNPINRGDEINLGRAEDMLYSYKDMFSIDYTSNSTGRVNISVTLSPAYNGNDSQKHIIYNYKCTPSMSCSSPDFNELIPEEEWLKDEKPHFYGYSYIIPSNSLAGQITSTEIKCTYEFSIIEHIYEYHDPWIGESYFSQSSSISRDILEKDTLSRRLSFSFKFDEDSYISATESSGSNNVYYIDVTIGVNAE